MIPLVHMFTLTQLGHALALRESGSFRRAAESQYISQPAFSRSIQKLESLLGAQLFNRQRGGRVTPTLFGEAVLRRADTIFEDTDELIREINLLKGIGAGSLSIAMGAYVAEISASNVISEMATLHPDLKYRAIVTGWHEVLDLIFSREVDIGIAEISIATDLDRLQVEPVAQHDVVYFCRRGHPLLKRKKFSASELNNQSLVSLRLPPRAKSLMYGRHSIDPDTGDVIPSIEINNVSTARAIVSGSDAISIATPIQLEPWLASGELQILSCDDIQPKLGYGFIFLRDRMLSPAAELYMQKVRALEKQLKKKNKLLLKKYSNA